MTESLPGYSTSHIFSFHLVGPPVRLQDPIAKKRMPTPKALQQLPPHAPVRKAKMLDAPYVPILRQALSDVPRHILKAKYLRSAEQLLQTNLGRMHVAQHGVALVANELDPCLAVPPPHSIFAIVIRHLSATPACRAPGRVLAVLCSSSTICCQTAFTCTGRLRAKLCSSSCLRHAIYVWHRVEER